MMLWCEIGSTMPPEVEWVRQLAVSPNSDDLTLRGLALCSLFSVTGHPVGVLPLGGSADGLPIGLQVVGRRWGEMKLLAVAQAIDYVRT